MRRGNLLQDCLPVKFQDVKLKDSKFKHEIFVRIDIKHSNYFITCLQLFVVCQNLFMLMHNFCSCYVRKF